MITCRVIVGPKVVQGPWSRVWKIETCWGVPIILRLSSKVIRIHNSQLSQCLLRHTQCVLPPTASLCSQCLLHIAPCSRAPIATACCNCMLSHIVLNYSHCLLPLGVTCVLPPSIIPTACYLVALGCQWDPSRYQVVRPSNKLCEKNWVGGGHLHSTQW